MMDKSSSSTARPIKIAICTSASKSNIKAFITEITALTKVTVKFIQLPYNDLDSFSLSNEGLDGVIVCHSINNRRFAITDVMDALYDKFLRTLEKEFGKDNVCVIAHDFPWPMGTPASTQIDHNHTKESKMAKFKKEQPTTFKCSKLVMVCGGLEKRVDMDDEDWTGLENFVRQCRVQPHRSEKSMFALEFLGFKIDFKDPRFILGGLVVLLLVAFILKPYFERFLCRCLEVIAWCAVLGLLIPLAFRVYHSRGKGPQVFKNDTYWGIILVVSILGNIYVVVRLNRAGGYVVFLLLVVAFIALVYQRRRQGAKKSRTITVFYSQGKFQWLSSPWWEFPYRFWLHFGNASVTYVNSLY